MTARVNQKRSEFTKGKGDPHPDTRLRFDSMHLIRTQQYSGIPSTQSSIAYICLQRGVSDGWILGLKCWGNHMNVSGQGNLGCSDNWAPHFKLKLMKRIQLTELNSL